MGEVKKIKAVEIFTLVSEIIAQGQSTRIGVTGTSMYPFLRDSVDSVEFSRADFNALARGDIVLIRRTDGAYVMHRIIKASEQNIYIIGDAQQWIEGPIYPDQLIAVVSAVWRKDNRILCSSWWWKIMSEVWLILRPFRNLIFRVYGKARKLI